MGETSRSGYTRFHGHLNDLRSALRRQTGLKSGSWMAQHISEIHEGQHSKEDLGADWILSIGGQHLKALDRQVEECVLIIEPERY